MQSSIRYPYALRELCESEVLSTATLLSIVLLYILYFLQWEIGLVFPMATLVFAIVFMAIAAIVIWGLVLLVSNPFVQAIVVLSAVFAFLLALGGPRRRDR